ncbi:hypothetical protein ACFUNF_12960 [Streptomyces sp. NPDC057291]|uniref:hypothetical protein n=1 Tax=Streptomyces sp. NPDC057291 TaxID=3346087 RepID=UPI00362A478A
MAKTLVEVIVGEVSRNEQVTPVDLCETDGIPQATDVPTRVDHYCGHQALVASADHPVRAQLLDHGAQSTLRLP